MTDKDEIPFELKNDIKIAFDLFKNENNKITKLKLRTLLFSFDEENNYRHQVGLVFDKNILWDDNKIMIEDSYYKNLPYHLDIMNNSGKDLYLYFLIIDCSRNRKHVPFAGLSYRLNLDLIAELFEEVLMGLLLFHMGNMETD